MTFVAERTIAATRKPHECCACLTQITPGTPAIYYVGKFDGEVQTGHYHPDCREAEVAWNHETDTWGEDWAPLHSITSDEDWRTWTAWLREHHPAAAARLGL